MRLTAMTSAKRSIRRAGRMAPPRDSLGEIFKDAIAMAETMTLEVFTDYV